MVTVFRTTTSPGKPSPPSSSSKKPPAAKPPPPTSPERSPPPSPVQGKLPEGGLFLTPGQKKTTLRRVGTTRPSARTLLFKGGRGKPSRRDIAQGFNPGWEEEATAAVPLGGRGGPEGRVPLAQPNGLGSGRAPPLASPDLS